MKKIILLLILICPALLPGQTAEFDSLVNSGIDQIYSIQFDKAHKTFAIINKDYPNHPAGKFLNAMVTWWKIMLDFDNESYDDLFYDQLEETIDMCDDILDNDPDNFDAVFFKGGALGFRGRLSAVREDWLDAAGDGKDALPLVNKAYQIDPANVDVQLGFGIYNYYASVIPQLYPFVKPLMFFFPKGDKEKGIQELKNAAYNGKYTRTEAKYFLMTLYYRYEENYMQAEKFAEELSGSYPNNPVFEKYLGRVKRKRSYMKESAEIFKDIYDKCNAGLTGYNDAVKREASYYVAEQHFKNNEWQKALKYFKECRSISEKIDEDDTGFFVYASLYTAKCYDKLGQRELAVKLYEDVLDMDEYKDSYQQAEKYLQNPFGS